MPGKQQQLRCGINKSYVLEELPKAIHTYSYVNSLLDPGFKHRIMWYKYVISCSEISETAAWKDAAEWLKAYDNAFGQNNDT